MPGLKARKGMRISYSAEHAAQWLVALLIEEAESTRPSPFGWLKTHGTTEWAIGCGGPWTKRAKRITSF